jgi:DNA-directed RNA polymerase specialized sigma24 family protein
MQIAANQEADDVLQLDDALSRLAKEDARLSQVVDCRVFGGLSETETAEALGMSLRTVQRLWQQARDRLKDTLQASE